MVWRNLKRVSPQKWKFLTHLEFVCTICCSFSFLSNQFVVLLGACLALHIQCSALTVFRYIYLMSKYCTRCAGPEMLLGEIETFLRERKTNWNFLIFSNSGASFNWIIVKLGKTTASVELDGVSLNFSLHSRPLPTWKSKQKNKNITAHL